MAFINKPPIGFTLMVAVGFIAFHKARQPASIPSSAIQVDNTLKKTKPKPFKRRERTGPRTPPPKWDAVEETTTAPDNPTEETTDELRVSHEDKLSEYLEHLEVLDNPSVDELTMLGEMAFDANQADDAYDHYLEVIEEHTDDPSAVFALYKLAWTEYNLGDVEAAIDDMALVIEWTQDGTLGMEQTIGNAAHSDLKLFRSKLD